MEGDDHGRQAPGAAVLSFMVCSYGLGGDGGGRCISLLMRSIAEGKMSPRGPWASWRMGALYGSSPDELDLSELSDDERLPSAGAVGGVGLIVYSARMSARRSWAGTDRSCA